MSGAPSHLDLFDPKPKLIEMTGKDLPDSVRKGQRITTMTSGQKNLFCVGSPFKFAKYGQAAMDISELLPHLTKIVDDCTFVRSMHTDPINHDPAVTFFATGHQQPGRPTMGAWLAYGLGSDNRDLPSFVVLTSGGGGQTLQTRYWGSGFLPAQYGGVQFRNAGDPVLFVSNPAGISGATRRQLLDATNELNRLALGELGDPAISAQIENYELAFRMQTSVPELTDLSKEPKEVLDLYGATPGQPSLRQQLPARAPARRTRSALHPALPSRLGSSRRTAGGLRHEVQGDRSGQRRARSPISNNAGCSMKRWSSGAANSGARPTARARSSRTISGAIIIRAVSRCGWPVAASSAGVVYGETDDFGYNIVRDPVHVHDLHATLLHALGVDHKRLTFRHEGRDYRLTDIAGKRRQAVARVELQRWMVLRKSNHPRIPGSGGTHAS